jgi:hypothetical protein
MTATHEKEHVMETKRDRMMKIFGLGAVMLTALGALTAGAAAQCRVIDFENLSVGTTVSTQYAGVTFSAVNAPSGSALRIISAPSGGTSSGNRAVAVTFAPGQSFCSNFGQQFLRAVFDEPQPVVAFNLGEQLGTPSQFMRVRAYSTVSGGSPIFSQDIQSTSGIRTAITIGSPSGAANIRRIEVDGNNACPAIDDLRFDEFDLPSVALQPLGCVCGDDIVGIRGQTCPSASGTFAIERHEYRREDAPPGTPWTLATQFVTPLCGNPNAVMTNWNTAGIPEGWYYYRVTVENACGRGTSDFQRILIRRSFGTLTMDSPASGASVCGQVNLTGTVLGCGGSCGGLSYTVGFRPAGSSGAFQPVDPSMPTYNSSVLNNTFAVWDTNALGVPNGSYQIRVDAVNGCGHTATVTRTVVVDSSQCQCPGDLNLDGVVNVSDLLLLLSNWGPCF